MALIWIAPSDDLRPLLHWPLALAALRASHHVHIELSGSDRAGDLTAELAGRTDGPGAILAEACDARWQADGWVAASEEARAEGDERVHVTLAQVPAGAALEPLTRHLKSGEYTLLVGVLPRGAPPRGALRDAMGPLLRQARCEVVVLRPGRDDEAAGPILASAAHSPHARLGLRLADELASQEHLESELVYVEPDLGSMAEQVGRRILDRLGGRALGDRYDQVRKKVLVADDVVAALSRERAASGARLLVLGASATRAFSRQIFGAMAEKFMRLDDQTWVAVIRGAMPLMGRGRRLVEELLQDVVPQMEREGRIEMVERVQSNSNWDFDFRALICLATIIATVGLLQDSAAVIIGAMLVAPLMTPMLGMGLAIAQGNPRLVRASAISIGAGMATAFVIALLLGLLVPGYYEPTPEMLRRNWPGLLDLFVAWVSGLAAAYASSRSNLLAALPGVAIAASLVPPIATSGLALAIWDHDLARGSMLLFLTNMVAIVLASAMAMWSVGVRGRGPAGARATRVAGWGTLFGSLALGIFLGLGRPEYRAPDPVPTRLVQALRERLAPSWRLLELDLDRSVEPPELTIHVGGTEDPPAALASELQTMAQRHMKEPVDVYLRGHWAMEAPQPGTRRER